MYLPAAFYSTDLFWSCAKWLMILYFCCFFAFITWREDRKIKRLFQAKKETIDTVKLLRILHRRDKRLWLQVFVLLIIMAIADIHHDATQLPPDFFSPHVVEAPPAPQAKESADDRYDTILKKNSATAIPFSTITEFNEQNSKREAYIDWLKERYEAWFITYYYLQKCQKAGPDDYDIISHSLTQDLSAAHADGTVEGNILMAASGSYKEMYSDIPCDPTHLAATKSAYDANMQQVLHPQAAPTAKPVETKTDSR